VLTPHPDPRGFTLIEMMLAIAILGILLAVGLPTFTTWIQNQQIRNTAESILNGLQLAKAQAVRSNASTQLILTNATPIAANVGAAASTTGTNWIVRSYQTINPYAAADFIQGRSGQEDSKNATVAAGSGSFIFTALGRLLNAPAANVNIDVTSSVTYSGKRPMRVIVSPGGQILMCDPDHVDPGNPQFCP
jgi:type IV fimbrial biogenesis protein FimT